MIAGVVSPHREITLQLPVRDAGGAEHPVDAILDTGYNGSFSLPRVLITSWNLTWHRLGQATLADGSQVVFDVYEGIVIWDGVPRLVSIDELDGDPLIGMTLMSGYELNAQIVAGGAMRLTRLPPQP